MRSLRNCRSRDLLGQHAGNDFVEGLLKSSKLPYTLVAVSEDRASIGVKDASGEIFSAEELVVRVFSVIMNLHNQ